MPFVWRNQSLESLWVALTQREWGRLQGTYSYSYLWPGMQRSRVFEDSTEVNWVEGISPKSNLHTCLQLTRGKEKSKQRNIDREDTQAWEGSEWSVKWNVSCSFIPREIRDSLFYRVEDFMSFCTETISCPGPQRARTVLPGWLLLMQEVWVC